MRARNIKPSLFANEHIATMDPIATLLFIGLWCLADREGRLEDRPARIKLQLFPGRDVDVEAILSLLGDKGFILRYEVDGLKIIQVVNFKKHQRPHANEATSVLPRHSDKSTTKVASASNLGECDFALNPSSLNPSSLNPEEGEKEKDLDKTSQPQTQAVPPPETKPLPAPTSLGYHPAEISDCRAVVSHFNRVVESPHGTAGADNAVLNAHLDGVSYADLKVFADRYAAKCRAAGKDKQYRMSAAKFYGQGGYVEFTNKLEQPSAMPNDKAARILAERQEFIDSFKNRAKGIPRDTQASDHSISNDTPIAHRPLEPPKSPELILA